MDDSEAYMYRKPSQTGSRVSSRDHLTSTYTELNIQKDERVTDTQTGPHKQEPNDNSGNRAYCKFCLLFLVWAALFAIVVGLSIHVSQTGESKFTSESIYYELNSTLQSKIAENSQLSLSKKTCLKNLSALNSNLSDLKRMHNDLRQQFSEMETKYRSVNETKAQICALMTSRREKACSQDWISNEEGCYFISTFHFSYDAAKNYCSNFDSKLLEINSAGEQNFVDKAVRGQGSQYWIGKCKGGEVASNVVYQMNGGCAECIRYSERKHCSQVHYRFICEKSAPLCPDISEKIQDLCQQPVGTT